MKFGAVFPTTEIGNDPIAIRDWVQAAEALGYSRIVAFDHVIGAERAGREELLAHLPYDQTTPFHEPMVLFGYLAGLTSRIELATGVLVTSQRPTALVAKQAAEVDLLSGGRLVLGIGTGGSPVEHEAMGYSYATRFKRFEEQIPLLRRLWTEPVVDFTGNFDRIERAGLAPLPARSIPIWIGGQTDTAYRRAARLGDGFIFGSDGEKTRAGVARIREFLVEAGRSPSVFPMDMYTAYSWGPDHWRKEIEAWQALGGTNVTVRTTDASFKVHNYPRNDFTSPQQHIDALRRFRNEVL